MKILVIGPSWIGDMVMSQSLYRLLITLNSNVEIHVMALEWCRPLLKYMPEVNRSLVMPIGHNCIAIRDRYLLGRYIQKKDYQQAIILPNSFKSALVPFFANIPLRTGWCGEMRYGLLNDIRFLNKRYFPLMVQRYAALAFDSYKIRSSSDLPTPLPWPILKVNKADQDEVLNVFKLNNKFPLIGFCPGSSFGSAKCWPYYHYANLAYDLICRNYHVVLFGSFEDRLIGEAISNYLFIDDRNYYSNLIGKTSLEQVIMLLATCQGIVSNDSGLMHIASAVNRPVVALYGPSSPDFTAPLSRQARIIRLISGYYKIRVGNCKYGYHDSLIAIQPSYVLSELEKLLASQK